mmetsp:Transcript_8919/g.22060  ORF Transcript_8919/g.22060 Transcript_8919/m.22060 type:complete len:269 (+) Transcript_8919:266-1072(+)
MPLPAPPSVLPALPSRSVLRSCESCIRLEPGLACAASRAASCARSSATSWRYRLTSALSSRASFALTATRTSLARMANLSVLAVSSNWAAAGVMLQTMAMRAPEPVSEFCSSRVSLESRNGMWWCLAPLSASLWMTVPSVSSDLLMKEPSMRWPWDMDTLALSEPARSMSEMTAVVVASTRCLPELLAVAPPSRSGLSPAPPGVVLPGAEPKDDPSTTNLQIVCDLLLSSLYAVALTLRYASPRVICAMAASALLTTSSCSPSTTTPL